MTVFFLRIMLVLAVMGLHSVAPAAIIQGLDPARHDRFQSDGTPNANFLLDETQLSGVALNWAVLITPRHYIAAAHVDPTEVTFRGTDGIERTYQSASSRKLITSIPGQAPVGSDVHLHTLSMEVDASIEPVPVVVGDLGSLVGQTFYAFDLQQRAGRNTIDALEIVQFDSGGSDTAVIRFSYDTDTNGGSGGLGQDEIGLLSGDSSNAALIEIDGQLGLIGTHMGVDVPEGANPALGDRYDSFSSLVGAYESELNALVAADGYSFRTISVTAIPEPTAVSLLSMLLGGVCFRRRARSKSS